MDFFTVTAGLVSHIYNVYKKVNTYTRKQAKEVQQKDGQTGAERDGRDGLIDEWNVELSRGKSRIKWIR
jgi:hypothetical protein